MTPGLIFDSSNTNPDIPKQKEPPVGALIFYMFRYCKSGPSRDLNDNRNNAAHNLMHVLNITAHTKSSTRMKCGKYTRRVLRSL